MTDERFYVNSINVIAYRGLKNIKIDHCKNINIILGDNNSGKTSFLESIYLLRNNDLYNFANVAECRKNKTLSISDLSFMHPFDTKKIEIHAKKENSSINFSSTYSIKEITFDKNYYFKDGSPSEKDVIGRILESVIDRTNANGKATKQYAGQIKYNDESNNFNIINLDFLRNIKKTDKKENKITYISPSAHYTLSDNGFSRIIKNKGYHDIIVALLQLFDKNITDIIVASGDDIFGSYGIEIRRKNHNESEPINLFGDGLKKVIVLATHLAQATGGILLIDEVETSLHYSLFNDVFSFLTLAAQKFNVQLFITTHSSETVDSMLNINDGILENTCLITLKNFDDGIAYRYLEGKEMKDFRKNFSFEAR